MTRVKFLSNAFKVAFTRALNLVLSNLNYLFIDRMYESIKDEALPSTDDKSLDVGNSNSDRDIFVDSLLQGLLGDEKLKQKDSLAEKIKYKRHQLETASKHLKRQEKLKKQTINTKSKKTKKVSCKLRKQLGLYRIDKSAKLNYESYLKLNSVWKSYAMSCLLTCLPKGATGNTDATGQMSEENVLNCLKQMDYHGCLLTVKRSNCKTLIGLSGLVLQDKRNVFYLLNKENKVILVPKQGSLFEFELFSSFKFTLVGSNMLYRPEMRITKHARIKTKLNIL